MTTLIAAYNSDGCYGRCDAKCYNAIGPDCECICGGANHGKGLSKALAQTTEKYEQWIEEYKKLHSDEVLTFDVFPKPVQLSMFEEVS